MKYSVILSLLLPALALAAPMPKGANRGQGASGSKGGSNNAAAASSAAAGANNASKNAAAGNSGSSAAASSSGVNADGFDPNVPPNPDPTFDPATSPGDLGPFVPVRDPSPDATGPPAQVSASDAANLVVAVNNWQTDTDIVSNFLNNGRTTEAGVSFNTAAHVAFAAEVDELTHKAILDKVIGNDPQVSIANLTLTNGVFQSVVNNLQIMSVQGKDTQTLIDTINQVRCTQILPSIDTYMAVVNRLVPNSVLKTSVRPDACTAILAANANNIAAFPNVPNVPGGTDLLSAAEAAKGAAAISGSGSASGSNSKSAGSAASNAGASVAASAAASTAKAAKNGNKGAAKGATAGAAAAASTAKAANNNNKGAAAGAAASTAKAANNNNKGAAAGAAAAASTAKAANNSNKGAAAGAAAASSNANANAKTQNQAKAKNSKKN